ncbi:MAG: AAA family ATPase [Aminipila sp.]
MKKFNTITTAELYAKNIERTPFIVDEILPRGLTILGGLGKVGKSWFSFWLAMQVANGEPVWGFKTTKGTTLYLAFEDSEERLQDRLFILSDEIENAPNNAHLCVEISKMGGELESSIRNFIFDYPDTKLIIIDTLQKVRGNTESNYISDYENLNILKNLADEYKIAIIVIHHLRKQKDTDIFNELTGSTAIQGAVDTMMVIAQSKRGDTFADFHIVG